MKSLAPISTDLLTVAGVSLTSDTTTSTGATATRTIVVTDAAGGAIPAGQTMRDFLTNFMTSQIAQALRAPVTADAVV